MNQLFHFIQSYRNWQKYLHLISFTYLLENNGMPSKTYSDGRQVWGVNIYITFYHDVLKRKMFKAKQEKKQLKLIIRKTRHTGFFKSADEDIKKEFEKIVEEFEKQREAIKQSEEYLGFFRNEENSTISALIKEAEECMLENNPLRTSVFLVSFLDKFKPRKKN